MEEKPVDQSSSDLSEIKFRGERLRELRHQRRLSADRLAKAAGLTTHHIFRLERGERPHVWGITVARLALVLETTTDFLMGLTDTSTPYKTRRRSHDEQENSG